MAGIKEIRTRIDSVQQTLKITNAMYLISSSKLRRARQQLNSVQPYFMKILIEKSVFFCNSLSLRNAIYGADGSAKVTAYAL